SARAEARRTTSRMSPRGHVRWHGWTSVLVAVVTLVMFLPSVGGKFLNWDDEANFTSNTDYRGLGLHHLKWMFTTVHLGPYQPLSWLTLGLDYLMWGMDPRGYNLTNIILHAVTAGLLAAVVARLVTISRRNDLSVALHAA